MQPKSPSGDPQDKSAATKAALELQERQRGEPVKTVADEQRERSEEMQKVGVDKWMSQFDQRPPEERPRQVQGVGFRDEDDRRRNEDERRRDPRRDR
jgi:hypothetical protein